VAGYHVISGQRGERILRLERQPMELLLLLAITAIREARSQCARLSCDD